MIETFGYLALCISLLSVSMKDMKWFRWFHIAACILYLCYGIFIEAMPLIIGAILFVLIHCYRLYRLYRPVLDKRTE